MNAGNPVSTPRVRHVAHLLYRFSAGGLENILVQIVNHLPASNFRHTIIVLTRAEREFTHRLTRADVDIVELDKRPGQPFTLYPAFFRLLRRLKPDVLHTCNLAALEFMPVAALAGVPLRIHAEHGWDVNDPDGSNRHYRLLRRVYRPFVHQYVAVSTQLRDYLSRYIGVPANRLHLIANGVDLQIFRPAQFGDLPPDAFPFRKPDHWVLGTVGRLEPIKNQVLLAKAFVRMVSAHPERTLNLRIAIVGGGPLAVPIVDCFRAAGLQERLWIPGPRADVARILRNIDCFVLPSLSEGTSCTLQEAMACGVPIIATNVGGNADLLGNGEYGTLVQSMDTEGLANAMMAAFAGSNQSSEKAERARAVVSKHYSLGDMLTRYCQLFQGK